jgi:LPXTG-motif cell wall-anchored protein
VESTDPHFFTEDYDHYLYKYHIEEEWIGSEPNKVGETAAGSGKWVSNDGDYRVTYENNDVATNESGNPIVVTNTYIWYRLPETGGMGVDAIYVSGILLTLTGFIGGYAFKRRERRFR